MIEQPRSSMVVWHPRIRLLWRLIPKARCLFGEKACQACLLCEKLLVIHVHRSMRPSGGLEPMDLALRNGTLVGATAQPFNALTQVVLPVKLRRRLRNEVSRVLKLTLTSRARSHLLVHRSFDRLRHFVAFKSIELDVDAI